MNLQPKSHPFLRVFPITGLIVSVWQDRGQEPKSPQAPVHKLLKNSGIYAIAAAASPLISLLLAPLLTRCLSPTDYGILTILNLCISLGAGISQLGLPSAFFRAYKYDYDSSDNQRDVIATLTALLCIVSLPIVPGVIAVSSFLAQLLFGRSALGNLVILAAVVLLVQNLTVPGFAWLRAENRALSFSILLIGSLLVTLVGNIILVYVLHTGITGSLIASGCGYTSIVLYMFPILLFRTGIKIRPDIARNLLSFGLPLVLSFVSYWILQLSDRYLLSLFTSLAQTAIYSVSYSIGSVINTLIIGPFALAWPATMFTIARREDATQIFRNLFRRFSLFLIFCSFFLSYIGELLLKILFPMSYHSSSYIIPVISASIVFYGINYFFIIGVNIKRKTWLTTVYTTIAAIVNVALNLILIPHYSVIGAALSTLFAYIILAFLAYAANQKIYPISFEINIFIIAFVLSAVFYAGSDVLGQAVGAKFAWAIGLIALCLCGGSLTFLAKLPISNRKNRS